MSTQTSNAYLSNLSKGSKSPAVVLSSTPHAPRSPPAIAVPHTFLSNKPTPTRRTSTTSTLLPVPKPNFTPPPPNSIAFTTIPVTSLSHARDFYASVFNWTFPSEVKGDTTQAVFFTPGNSMGALTLSTAEKIEGGVVNYILVEDVGETLEKVKNAGGKVEREKWVEGGHTELAMFRDSDGNLGGLLKWLI